MGPQLHSIVRLRCDTWRGSPCWVLWLFFLIVTWGCVLLSLERESRNTICKRNIDSFSPMCTLTRIKPTPTTQVCALNGIECANFWHVGWTNWAWIVSLLKKGVILREVDRCIHTHIWSSGTGGFGPGGASAAISKNWFYLKQSMEKIEFKSTV